jgi:hypothetical protein
MGLWRRMGLTFARFVALSATILGVWIFVVNSIEHHYDSWIGLWVILSGLAGAIGGPLFLVSIDGPGRWRSRRARTTGWVLMLASALLPHSLTILILPLVLALAPSVFSGPWQETKEKAVTSG